MKRLAVLSLAAVLFTAGVIGLGGGRAVAAAQAAQAAPTPTQTCVLIIVCTASSLSASPASSASATPKRDAGAVAVVRPDRHGVRYDGSAHADRRPEHDGHCAERVGFGLWRECVYDGQSRAVGKPVADRHGYRRRARRRRLPPRTPPRPLASWYPTRRGR